MSDPVKDAIVDFLKTARYGTLATVSPEGKPVTHAMAFASKGSTLYFATSRKTRKFVNIEANPNVAFSAEEVPENMRQITGVQVQGVAQMLNDVEKGNALALLIAKYPIMAVMPADPDMVFIKVTVSDGYMLDYTKGFGHRDHTEFGE